MKDADLLPQQFKTQGSPKKADGKYVIPHIKIDDYLFLVLASTGLGWDHVSITIWKNTYKKTRIDRKTIKTETIPVNVERCPTWEEMCFIKELFFEPTECAVQYHPPMADYISNHKWCLHIFKPQEMLLPMPPSVMVGLKNEELDAQMAAAKALYPGKDDREYMNALYYADVTKVGTEMYDKILKELLAPETLLP